MWFNLALPQQFQILLWMRLRFREDIRIQKLFSEVGYPSKKPNNIRENLAGYQTPQKFVQRGIRPCRTSVAFPRLCCVSRSVLHVWSMFMSMLHVHFDVVCPCSCYLSLSMVHVYVSMLHVHTDCTFCVYMLHVHASCPYCLSLSPWCMSMMNFHDPYS